MYCMCMQETAMFCLHYYCSMAVLYSTAVTVMLSNIIMFVTIQYYYKTLLYRVDMCVIYIYST